MHRMKIAALTATVALGVLTGVGGQASAQGVTAYEGVRVIVGDGRVLDNTTLVVSGTKITQVGGTVPAGATRVNLAGKTVMPMLIDTHTHLSATRDKLVLDLRQRAYFGDGAALSLGTANYELLDLRNKDNDDEMLSLYKSKPNLVVNPNLPDRGIKQDLSWLKASLAPADYAKLEEGNTERPQQQAAYGIQARNLAKINAAGVKIVLGTDGNRARGPHKRAAHMVAAVMTPIQCIIAATKNGAEFLRMSDTGTLETGKNADFIVLDANPLDDIANTRKIASVYLRGTAVDRSQLPR